jgi:hypothetical protein
MTVRNAALVLVGLTAIPIGARAAVCSGADTAITNITVQRVTHTQYVNVYHLAATVQNLGTEAQSSDVLQFVDVLQYGNRLDAAGMPPLGVGGKFTYSYLFLRSRDAGSGTTTLLFHVRFVRPVPPGREDCDPSNDHMSVTF